jgi:hypothetical protein
VRAWGGGVRGQGWGLSSNYYLIRAWQGAYSILQGGLLSCRPLGLEQEVGLAALKGPGGWSSDRGLHSKRRRL